MPLTPGNLHPYASLVLLRANGDPPPIADLTKECLRALPFDQDAHLNPLAAPLFPSWPGLDLGVLLYEERRPPSWLIGSEELRDLINHLLVVARRERLIALYMSDTRRRAAVVRWLEAVNGGRRWHLESVDPEQLDLAFVRGPVRTLWLSGVHVQVTSRADSKVLSGMNLRHALDPLGDQTYYFTAARSTIPELRLPVGVSPRGSRVWVGASRDWDHFCTTVDQVLETLETGHVAEPLPVVAVPSHGVPDLADAFDLHLIPPEVLTDDVWEDPDERERLERWALRARFDVVGAGVKTDEGEQTLDVAVDLEGRPLATARLTFDLSEPNHVTWTVAVQPASAEVDEADVEELDKVLRRRRWLRLWFESGLTLSDGVVFEVRHRDLPFLSYTWADFSGYRVKTEKFWKGALEDGSGIPAIDRIGTRGSLFCWLRNHWPPAVIGERWTVGPARGWLACDDGAMEIADFIHLDDHADPPVLSLVHVKGAKSEEPDRGISVSAYEVVVGQAVKNLRFLDRLNLAEGVEAGLETQIGKLVWHDGAPADRDAMIAALAKVGTGYLRRVIVLQPQVTESGIRTARATAGEIARAVREAETANDPEAAKEARASAHKGDVGRLRQLDTLLLAAQATARGLGASLIVVGDGTP